MPSGCARDKPASHRVVLAAGDVAREDATFIELLQRKRESERHGAPVGVTVNFCFAGPNGDTAACASRRQTVYWEMNHADAEESPSAHPDRIVVIGAGPAGLTAAYALAKAGKRVLVLEADETYVGGISRTVLYHGFRFDIGGHRFFSKSAEIEALWTEILGADMLTRPRLSRIFYRGQFFAYPIRAVETLRKLGLVEAIHCLASYAKARLSPVRNPRSVEEWVINQFGRRLYEMFFKTYTEKVWGLSCRDISADWAAQRIKGLSLSTTITEAVRRVMGRRDSGRVAKSLIESFRYPRLGPGMMWEACRDAIVARGGEVRLGHRVERLRQEPDGAWAVESARADGTRVSLTARHVISSAPLADLLPALVPAAPSAALDAAAQLHYRDFITVALMVRGAPGVPDNWLYIHEPKVKVGRVQNYRAWSEDMVPDANIACYGLEYFCFEGDGLWTSSDADLIQLGTAELRQIGLLGPGEVVDACVVRQRRAYPVYDSVYTQHIDVIKTALLAYPRLQVVGRNGMHKYNNQDHSMMTALLAARNIFEDRDLFDVWAVNQDAEYHEEGTGASGERLVPQRTG